MVGSTIFVSQWHPLTQGYTVDSHSELAWNMEGRSPRSLFCHFHQLTTFQVNQSFLSTKAGGSQT